MKRIVFVTPLGEVGGAERSLLAWIGAVREAWPRAAVTLIVLGEGPLVELARELGVEVQVLPMPPELAGMGDSGLRGRGPLHSVASLARLAARAIWAAPAGRRYVRQLRDALRRRGPELIHSNGIKTHLLLTQLARSAGGGGAAVVWHLHDFIGDRPLVARALRWAAGGAAGIAVSRAVAENARAALPGTRVVTAYNVVDTDRFAPDPPGEEPGLDDLALQKVQGEALRQARGGPGAMRVALVATYARWKGQDTFLRAAAIVTREAGSGAVRFYIVGGPIYRTAGSQFSEQELREQASALGIADRVDFIPFQSETARVYRSADVVVHASTRPEPFGLTIVESMACGKPTIVSSAGGATELFTEGHDAIGFPPGDAGALAAAMKRLIENPGLRKQLGRDARATAVKRFDRRALSRRVVEVYDELCTFCVSETSAAGETL